MGLKGVDTNARCLHAEQQRMLQSMAKSVGTVPISLPESVFE